jgi:hypothetical protein
MKFNKKNIGEMLGCEVESFTLEFVGDNHINIYVRPKTTLKTIDVKFNITKDGSEVE